MKTDKILFSENKKLSSWHDLIHLTYDKVLINIKKKTKKTKNVAICANITLNLLF